MNDYQQERDDYENAMAEHEQRIERCATRIIKWRDDPNGQDIVNECRLIIKETAKIMAEKRKLQELREEIRKRREEQQ
jgi:hypothetical protein